MRTKITKLARYYWLALKYDVKAIIAYPASFWMAFLSLPTWVAVQLVFIETIYGQTETLLGYTKYESYLMYGTYKIVQSLMFILFYVRLWDLAEKIRGSSDWSLDMMLLKPIDSQLFATTGRFWLPSLSALATGVGMVWYALVRLDYPILAINWLPYLAVVFVATLLMYALFLMIQTTMFWLDYTQAGESILVSIQDFGKYPRQMYQGGWGVILNVFIPVTLMGSVPVDYLLGRIPLTHLVLGGLVTTMFLILSRMFWLRSLKEYSSFSS